MAVDASERVALTERIPNHTSVSQQALSPASQQTAITPQSHLLALPAEVLHEILRQLLESEIPLSKLGRRLPTAEEIQDDFPSASQPFGEWHYYPIASFNLHPQLLRVCRHLYNAGWPILYKKNSWGFDIFHGPDVTTTYLHPDPALDGKVVCTESPFGNSDQDTEGPPESVRKHMEVFTFDVQFEALTYWGHRLSNSQYFYQLGDAARKMLTGEEKELYLKISTAPWLFTGANSKTEDPNVVDIMHYFAPFKSIRCGYVEVEVNGVRLETELGGVITSEEQVENELPCMWDEYNDRIGQLCFLQGFPHDLDARLRRAMERWDAKEFRSLRKAILEVVDKLIEDQRLNFERYRDSL